MNYEVNELKTLIEEKSNIVDSLTNEVNEAKNLVSQKDSVENELKNQIQNLNEKNILINNQIEEKQGKLKTLTMNLKM